MIEILLIVDVITAIALIALVLLQQSKSSDMGAVFGGGGSQTLFGSKGSANFLTRTTAVLAIIFFLSNVGLMALIARQQGPESVTKTIIETKKKPVSNAVKKEKPKAKKKKTAKDIPVPE